MTGILVAGAAAPGSGRGRRPASTRSRVENVPLAAAMVAAVGCGLLAARPLLALPTGPRVVLFTGLLVVGATWPLQTSTHDRAAGPAMSPFVVLAIGVAAFGLARVLGGGEPPVPALASFIVLNTLAAVAEEAFFRRHLYSLVESAWGPLAAVVGTGVAFAAVHVTVWGWWVLPLDLAAGLVLSWQRAATGRWSVPAATHVLANTLALL